MDRARYDSAFGAGLKVLCNGCFDLYLVAMAQGRNQNTKGFVSRVPRICNRLPPRSDVARLAR